MNFNELTKHINELNKIEQIKQINVNIKVLYIYIKNVTL